MPQLAVEILNVVKRYEGHTAVRDLSLAIPTGTVYGLLGPNGAGKTTTIRMLLDIIAPDEGTINVLGVPNTSRGAIDRVGYLPEERGLYRRMQVRRVLCFLAELKGVPRREALRRVDSWLERLGLKTAEHDWGLAKVDDLSRGMQQKVQFIGALLHDPELVILDEPFSGLDPINAQALKDIVFELKNAGKTVIFSTHMMDNAERMCDAVCIIARGEKILDGTMEAVKEEHSGHRVALELGDSSGEGDGRVENGGVAACVAEVLADRSLVSRVLGPTHSLEVELSPGGDAQRLLRRLVEAGANIRRFELAQPSLNRIFLDRVGAMGVEDETNGQI